jgi:hypothetical protein
VERPAQDQRVGGEVRVVLVLLAVHDGPDVQAGVDDDGTVRHGRVQVRASDRASLVDELVRGAAGAA